MADWHIERVADDDSERIQLVVEFFREYQEWLGKAVCSVRLAEEIATLPDPYSAPEGRLYLATSDEGLWGAP